MVKSYNSSNPSNFMEEYFNQTLKWFSVNTIERKITLFRKRAIQLIYEISTYNYSIVPYVYPLICNNPEKYKPYTYSIGEDLFCNYCIRVIDYLANKVKMKPTELVTKITSRSHVADIFDKKYEMDSVIIEPTISDIIDSLHSVSTEPWKSILSLQIDSDNFIKAFNNILKKWMQPYTRYCLDFNKYYLDNKYRNNSNLIQEESTYIIAMITQYNGKLSFKEELSILLLNDMSNTGDYLKQFNNNMISIMSTTTYSGSDILPLDMWHILNQSQNISSRLISVINNSVGRYMKCYLKEFASIPFKECITYFYNRPYGLFTKKVDPDEIIIEFLKKGKYFIDEKGELALYKNDCLNKKAATLGFNIYKFMCRRLLNMTIAIENCFNISYDRVEELGNAIINIRDIIWGLEKEKDHYIDDIKQIKNMSQSEQVSAYIDIIFNN